MFLKSVINNLPNKRIKQRKNSIAIIGGAFGDEGKGRIVDNVCSSYSSKYKSVIVYRWNGGANAGHTVQFGDKRLALHQIPSGVFVKNIVSILGKGMVLHPGDLIEEIKSIKIAGVTLKPEQLLIDEMAVFSLDTHRGFETCLKSWEKGGKGSTGRGISPAYADILLRHPVRLRDFKSPDWKDIFSKHYDLYTALIKGLGFQIASIRVASTSSKDGLIKVGTKQEFLKRLQKQRLAISGYVNDISDLLRNAWTNENIPFVFEGAQGVGLDARFGVYPDITASDPTFSGILSSTEGIIKPEEIQIKAGTIKATYMSSVGTRILPTPMHPALAELIRRDANEYGATTKRPRDIYHLDLQALKYFFSVAGITHLILTHLDISYPAIPLKICIGYKKGKISNSYYRPDQTHLNHLQPVYKEMPSWDGDLLKNTKGFEDFPKELKEFLNFICDYLQTPLFAVTFGPDRKDILFKSK